MKIVFFYIEEKIEKRRNVVSGIVIFACYAKSYHAAEGLYNISFVKCSLHLWNSSFVRLLNLKKPMRDDWYNEYKAISEKIALIKALVGPNHWRSCVWRNIGVIMGVFFYIFLPKLLNIACPWFMFLNLNDCFFF